MFPCDNTLHKLYVLQRQNPGQRFYLYISFKPPPPPPVASAAVCSVLLLFIYCVLLLPLFVVLSVRYLFCFAVLCVLSGFAVISLGGERAGCFNLAQGYKTFFVLNFTEHEISTAHKN